MVKIGGSTLGDEDTTLEDVVALRTRGERVIVVHGGGAMINDWLERLKVSTVFIDGLRSTNEEALDVVIAVLRGHGSWVRAPSFSADGTRVVTRSDDRTVRTWDAASGEPITVVRHEDRVYAASLNSEGTI